MKDTIMVFALTFTAGCHLSDFMTFVINSETCLRRSGEYPGSVPPPAQSHVHVVAKEAVGRGGGVGGDDDGTGLGWQGKAQSTISQSLLCVIYSLTHQLG